MRNEYIRKYYYAKTKLYGKKPITIFESYLSRLNVKDLFSIIIYQTFFNCFKRNHLGLRNEVY